MTKDIYRPLASLFLMMLFLVAPALAAESSFEKPALDSGRVTMTFADAPLKTMTETPFSIVIVDGKGETIRDAELSIAMDMPAMPMPPNNPGATWQNDAYRGTAIFTMAGAWQVTVSIQRPGQSPEEVVFDIEQVMMK